MPRTSRQKPSQESSDRTTRFTLKWKGPDKKGASLLFGKAEWSLFEAAAERRGLDPEEMISVAVAQLLGRIINYRLRT
jgi:hypothetical protein